MKNRHKLKIGLGGLLAVSLLGVLATFNLAPTKAYAFEEIQFAKQYVIGDIVTFPESGFSQGEDYYKAETVLYYPNGQAKMATSEKMSIPGEYTLEYRAEVEGQLYTKSYDFKVLEDLYSVSSSRSSVSYGVDESQYNTGLSGIKLSLAENNTFTYNKILNLNELKDESVISLMMLPKEMGTMEAQVVMVKLTDVYDPSNIVYVQISAVAHPHAGTWSQGTGMLFAGTSPNLMLGAYGDLVRNADTYQGYGYQFDFSFGDRVDLVGKRQASFSFDLDNKLLLGTTPQDPSMSPVFADLSDDSVYPSAWEGFTTGEVYLSLSCSRYGADVANVFITQIGNEDLTLDYYVGGAKPTIEVDTLDYEIDDLPIAEVGKTYPLFKATVRDFYQGKMDLQPRVFYRYDTWMQSEINVVNNAFTPDREGVYTLVYAYTDGFGNYSEEKFDVYAVENVPQLTASFQDEMETSAYLGIPVKLAEIVSDGGSGYHACRVEIALDEESIFIEDNEYVFTRAGSYEVSYTIRDYLGTEVALSYQIDAKLNPEPVAQGTVVLPKYFIEGQKYILPDFYFIDYSGNEAKSLKAKITVSDADGERELDSQEYVAKANEDGKVKVVYSVNSSNATSSLPVVEIPVVDVSGAENGKIDPMKYFHLEDGMSIAGDPMGFRFSATKDSSFEFINPLLANTFVFSMKIDENANDFNSVDVYLTDSIDKTEAILLSLKKGTDNAMNVYINGKRVGNSLTGYYANGSVIEVTFSQSVLSVGGNQVYQNLKRTLTGEPFNGFSSGKVYLKVALNGVASSNSAIVVRKLNNQNLSTDLVEDLLGPQVSPKGNYELVQSLGETMTVLDAISGDVLNNYTECTISVSYGGKPVKSVDGVMLLNAPLKEYQFVLSEYGSYSIVYNVYDANGNSARGGNSFNVFVLDEIAPTLEINGDIPQEVGLGANVTLPKATVSDNVTTELSYYVYVGQPDGMNISCTQSLKFKATQKGIYVVTYLTVDEDGNLTVKKFTVTVK